MTPPAPVIPPATLTPAVTVTPPATVTLQAPVTRPLALTTAPAAVPPAAPSKLRGTLHSPIYSHPNTLLSVFVSLYLRPWCLMSVMFLLELSFHGKITIGLSLATRCGSVV